jgi:hypothetical protein
LKISTLELADLVQQKALSNTGMHIFSLKAQIEKEKETARDEAARRIDSMSFDKELQKLLHECDVSATSPIRLPAYNPAAVQYSGLPINTWKMTSGLLMPSAVPKAFPGMRKAWP